MLMLLGDPSVEVTNESRDESQIAKSLAMEALAEKVIEHLTEAILLNSTSAIMYGTSASVYTKMKKPNASSRDANAPLKNFYLSSDHKNKLKEFGVEPWTFMQKLDEAVFIPAGCLHQVRNLMVRRSL
ncbi:hypothetical protein GIB67_002029 [Kingdonia uniflora]|uniref:JmjC domain-containing protein n=1 Tax=Kingdonia uniflora TaxID=39325 RepID=A0A7J7MA25_9MAGN|nr:hypothetical protein GIB67_002029 [Kingdonia uniflora]